MAGVFGGGGGGGGGGAAPVMTAPAAVAPVVVKKQPTSGPQLAPGQRVPGGPILPIEPEAVMPPIGEDEETRRMRLLAAQRATILGEDMSWFGGSANGDSGGAADAGPGDGAGSADGSAY